MDNKIKDEGLKNESFNFNLQTLNFKFSSLICNL